MDPAHPARRTLIDIAYVSQRIFNTLQKCSGQKTVETFQLEKIVVASGAILETLNKTLLPETGTIDDRTLDWLNGEEPKTCLDVLNRMQASLRPMPDRRARGVWNPLRSSRSPKDQNMEACRLFWDHKVYFYFLLSTNIWNRESGARQTLPDVPPSNPLPLPKAVAPATRPQAGDPSSTAQDKKTKKPGFNTKKLNSIVRWLSASSSREIHERTVDLRQPDTCIWLPDTIEFKAWRNNENSFLWLHGKPGAGKSVLAASVIDNLKNSLEDGEVLAYFYCDFRNERSTGAAEVMRALLSQLLRKFNSDIADPGDLIDQLEEETSENATENAKKFASYVTRAAKYFGRRPFIVLDALDECKDVEELLVALKELNRSGIRLFVTSRPLQVIKNSFKDLPSISMDAMRYEVSEDIRLHIEREMDSHHRLRNMDSDLKNETHSKLCKKADGMFRWAQCQLAILKRCMTTVQVREALYNLPSSLNETYERILAKISEAEREGVVARRALDWLIVAWDPLELSQLMEILSVDPDKQVKDCASRPFHGSVLLDVLGSLVTHDEMTDIVILSHFSVKEYLIAKPTQAIHQAYHVDEEDAHAHAARLCMYHIGLQLEDSGHHFAKYEAPCQTTSNKARKLLPGTDGTIGYRLSPAPPKLAFLDEYAISRGFWHIRCVNPGNKDVMRAIKALSSSAQQHPSRWADLYSRSNEYSAELPTLKHDFMLFLLVKYACEPLLRSFLGQAKLKLKDGTNPLIYAAYFGQIEHARTLLSRGTQLNYSGWDVDGPDQILPLEVAVKKGHYDIVDLFLAEGSPVPPGLFATALQPNYDLPGCIVSRLLQTDEFTEWAVNVQDEQLFLRALDPTRYDRAGLSQQDVDIIQLRLEQLGYDPSVRFNEMSLRHAVSAGHVSTVRHMLSQNISLPPDIILDASRPDIPNTEMIHLCLSNGCNVHVTSSAEDTALHLALATNYLITEDGHSEIVHVLIDAGCDPNATNLAGETPLHLAVRKCYYVSIAEDLLSHCSVHMPPDILFAAAESHSPPMMQLLTTNEADVHAISADGATPLHRVLYSTPLYSEDCLACVKILIGAGCNPCLPDAYGQTLLDVAAANGHLSVMQYLHGMLKLPFSCDILLSAAISPEPIDHQWGLCIKFLIQKGSDIRVTCPNGDTLLHLLINKCLEEEALKRIQVLVNAGCDPSACNLTGETIFHVAAKWGYMSVMEYLVDAGCDPRARNLAGETPFHVAAMHGLVSVMEYLLSLGLSVSLDTILTHVREGELACVRFFLGNGGDMYTITEDGDTLLHLVASCNDDDALELAKYLVQAGCNPHAVNLHGETPLHVAAENGTISIIKYLHSLNAAFPPDVLLAASRGYFGLRAPLIRYLVQEGADVSVAMANGNTPLHLLLDTDSRSEDDRLECVKVLIDAGCDPLAQNSDAQTPLHAAARSGLCAVLEYLLSQGVQLPHDILLASREATTMGFLLKKGLDFCSVAPDDMTKLMHNVRSWWEDAPVEFAKILIDAGWDPSLKNSEGETVIHTAVRNGNITAIKYFLSQNVPLPSDVLLAAVPSIVHDPWLPCHTVPLTRFLIREGASINVSAPNRDTLLHLTITQITPEKEDHRIQRESWKVIEILLNSGADPSARNADGKTSLDLAEEKGPFFYRNFQRLVQNAQAHRRAPN